MPSPTSDIAHRDAQLAANRTVEPLLAVPSSLVSTSPVRFIPCENTRACRMAFLPSGAINHEQISCGGAFVVALDHAVNFS